MKTLKALLICLTFFCATAIVTADETEPQPADSPKPCPACPACP